MRTLSVLALALVTASCASGPDPQIEANKALVLRFAEAQNNLDYELLEELVADDLRRHCQATPDIDVRSRDEFLDLLRFWETATPDMRVTINQMLAEDDRVAVHATLVGTQSGPIGDIPATGRPIRSDYLAILRIADNQIAEIWVEWDNVTILTQLGMFPPPEAG
jgi:steroid delta-isomerase-like uncharacterized protein